MGGGSVETRMLSRVQFLAEMDKDFSSVEGGYRGFLRRIAHANLSFPLDDYQTCGVAEGQTFTSVTGMTNGQVRYRLDPAQYDQYTSSDRFPMGEHASVCWIDGEEKKAEEFFRGAHILYVFETSSFGNTDETKDHGIGGTIASLFVDETKFGNLTFTIYPVSSGTSIGLSGLRGSDADGDKFEKLMADWQRGKRKIDDDTRAAFHVPNRPWDVRQDGHAGALRFLPGPVTSDTRPNGYDDANYQCEWPENQWTRIDYGEGIPVADLDHTPNLNNSSHYIVWLSEGDSTQEILAYAVIDRRKLESEGEVTIAAHPTDSHAVIVEYGADGRSLHEETPNAITIGFRQ